MIERWNSVVQNEDMVYILGDFCWNKEDEWNRILNKLKGNKTLIIGNHDLKQMSSNLRNKFADIKDYKEIIDGDLKVIMCHYPIMCYKHSFDPYTIMLHGHTHNHTHEEIFVRQWRKELCDCDFGRGTPTGNILNVGCMFEYMNYIPRDINYLFDVLTKIKKGEYILND